MSCSKTQTSSLSRNSLHIKPTSLITIFSNHLFIILIKHYMKSHVYAYPS